MAKIFVALGGNDLEMELVSQILAFTGVDYAQPRRECGRHKHDPADLGLTIAERTKDGRKTNIIKGYDKVYFFECRPSADWPEGTPAVLLDDHEAHVGRPPAILQLIAALELYGQDVSEDARDDDEVLAAKTFAFALTTIKRSLHRWLTLVAVNDIGYIPALRAIGATDDEIKQVRREERRAFGITSDHEEETARGIREAVQDGPLTIVDVPHNKFGSVTDQLYGNYKQLVVFTTDPANPEVNFFGDGSICSRLHHTFGGRGGGAGYGQTGKEAYWEGFSKDRQKVLSTIREGLVAA